MAEQPKAGYPLIVVLGIDPAKHEIPPLLHHHLQKMGKDFPIVFWAEEDLDAETWKSIQEYVKKIGFVPKLKQRIIKPEGNIIKP